MIYKLRRPLAALLCGAALLLAGTAVAGAAYKVGDADTDGSVTILDATAIQRHLAGLPVNSFSEKAADANGSGDIEITDATYIQRWLASMPTSYPIGEEVEEPTAAPTQQPTDPDGWGQTIYRP